MKLCLNCGEAFSAESWSCPSCRHAPQEEDGFLLFAPDLAASNDGMSAEAHHLLDSVQHRSFWFRARNRLIVDLVRRHFAQARAVLELGCGTGYVLSGLQAALPSLRLSGSEIYANGLPYARRRLGPDVALFQMDARAIPFAEEFDLICAFDVLEHIEEDASVLDRIRRALRPDGGILLAVPQHPFLWSQTDEIAYHKRRYRTAELQEKCRAAGFKVLQTTSFVSTLMPFMLAQRLLRGRKANYDAKAEMDLPSAVDHCFEAILDGERRLIGTGLAFPFGGSRFVAAVKA
jgi:SAM-dependent methyltransferase